MINYLVNVKQKNGSKIQQANTYEDVRRLAIGKEKVNLPALTTHSGVRGTYTPTNLFFIDIDIDTHTQEVIQNREEIFNRIPCIAAIQKSFSGKLHLICIHSLFDMIPTQEEWLEKTRISSIAVLHMLKSGFNIDFLNNIAFDFHNLNWTQLFFVSANPFYINEHANGVKISEKDANLLKLTYQEFFNKSDIKESNITQEVIDFSEYKTISTSEKITIDRNFSIGSFKNGEDTIDLSGNELRWRIGTALLHIFGDLKKAKSFVEKHFTNPKEFTYYEKTPNKIVMKWLLETFFQKKEEVIIPNGKYLSDYHNEILEAVKENDKIQIRGTVGIGKSTEIIQLAKELKAVLIVPYLSTNELYEGEIEIVSSENSNLYDPEKPQCMVFDQAMKYNLSNRVVIVDESHTLFLERDFRESAIILLPKLENVKKLILVSATPCNELERLGGKEILTYTKKHNNIYITPYFYENYNEKLYSIEKTIEEHLSGQGRYDIVCIMDDSLAQSIYNVYCKQYAENILYFRSNTKESFDCREMFSTELLTKKLVICTRVAFNGVNFKNVNQKILLITSLNCPQLIIQQTGRFRNTSIDVHLYVDDTEVEKELDIVKYMKEKYEYTQLNNAELLENNPLCEVPGFFDAYAELIKFYNKYNYENVRDILLKEGYFIWKYPVLLNNSKKATIVEPNKTISNLLKQNIIPKFEDLSVSERTSFKKISDAMEKFCVKYNIEPLIEKPLDFDVFLGIKEEYKRDKSWLLKLLNSFDVKRVIPSILEELDQIVWISKKSEKDFLLQTTLLENWINIIQKNIKLTQKVKLEKSKLKKVNCIRDKHYTGSSVEILDSVLNENTLRNQVSEENRKEGRKKGGKKGSPKKAITIVNEKTNAEKTFSSQTECMVFLRISPNTYSKFINGKKLKKFPWINDWKIIS